MKASQIFADRLPSETDLLGDLLLGFFTEKAVDHCKAVLERVEARGHLGAALMQVVESDDKIIVEHVREAYKLLGGKEVV